MQKDCNQQGTIKRLLAANRGCRKTATNSGQFKRLLAANRGCRKTATNRDNQKTAFDRDNHETVSNPTIMQLPKKFKRVQPTGAIKSP